MTPNYDAYPLSWPVGWKRTPAHRRQRSRYGVSFARARDELMRSLSLMGARGVVVSSNLPLRRDGLPYANSPEPVDAGVAVYWSQRGQQRVMACDCWLKVRDNIRAIGLAVEALRAIDRAGASQILERAFVGFNALPAEGVKRSWRQVLGLDFDRPLTRQDIEVAYRHEAKRRHPDAGGSAEAFHELTAAREQALKEVSR